MDPKFLKPYDPAATEPRIYAAWEKSGYFNPDTLIARKIITPDAKPFTIMMPPPNVTGVLHMGHALMLTLEDIMIRFRRMQGRRALWIPGTDHAAIATQSRVEKEIAKKEGKNRHDLGREEMLRRIEAFAHESHETIVSQIRVMGASCDWSREAFTLDEARNRAVNTLFKQMFDAGLIYRGHRIVNWDPKGQTTISDDEIVHEERKTTLYTFRYSEGFPIPISTTRPETKVGDVAVAVHPTDTRYQQYIGKTYSVTFCGVSLTIKIVADEAADPAFGTGAVGVTPAHSQTDWEIAERHDLPTPQVINEYAKMTVGDERILGKKTTEAREVIVAWLRTEGLIEKEEEITHNVATAERTGGIVEPLPKLQWFVAVDRPIAARGGKTLKQLMREPVASGAIKIIPDYFDKTYFNWIDNLRDWCISRQIWYGHRVPVWYREEEIAVGEAPAGEGWVQDEDTLDTWFSSGAWSFSALGWPDQTADLATYHPTDVLETGYEILFFWIARMILMSGFALGEIPFHSVYLHGTVRDAQGRKMSKSLGNGIDPIEIAAKYGADAARMALVVGNTPGTDLRIAEDKIKGYKHFANKLWNIARFVLTNTAGADSDAPLTTADTETLAAFHALAAEVTADLEEYRLHLAAEKLYHYVWHTFADTLVEAAKPRLENADDASIRRLLNELLEGSLTLLHPFMPFVTEEIWGSLPARTRPLIVTPWPSPSPR